MASIPLHLVNGFLGSGKTTFLMHYLDTFSRGRKIAVIQNEFSTSGIDGDIVRHHCGAYRMLEINNGSVFCVCLLGSFIDSLAAFIQDNPPDEIIMEASGISDPISIGQIFQSPVLKGKVYLGYSWAIVDAKNFNRIIPIRARLEHQIRIADTVVINKSELAGEEMNSVLLAVKKINPFANVQCTNFAKIDFEEKKMSLRFYPANDCRNSQRPDLQSVVIKTNRLISRENLGRFIESIKDEFIRFKGFVNAEGNKKLIVQGSFADYTFEEMDWFSGGTELVGIGSPGGKVDYTRKFETYCD